MRTEGASRLGALATWVLAASAAALAQAAEVTFEPTLDVNAYYDGNVHGVGETDDPALDDPSAVVGGIGLTLPWTINTPSTTYTISYRPRREVYQDEARPDFTSHNLNASFAKTLSERASYALTLDYDRSDRQELNPLRPTDALTYLPRRTFESGGIGGSGTFASGRRSSVSWRLGARLERGDDLPESPFEDSESYDAAVGWSFEYSPQGDAGIATVLQHFAYESGGSVDVVSLGHTGTRQFSRDGSLTYAVGALRSDDGVQSNVNGSVNVGVNWTLGPHSALSAGARQGASAGDGVSGASLDRGGYVTWSYARPRGFGAAVSAAYWDRSNLLDESAPIDAPSAFTISDSLSWRLGRFFRIGIFHTYQNQSSDSGDPLLATDYHTAGLTWTWILRGERGERAERGGGA